jgi:cell division protease FtsH
VTIVPRGRSLGAAWYLPEERQITTTEQLLDEMCSALGGRAAEEIMFGKISTGALSDLEKVTKQAYAMVSVYGLSEKVGNISYYDPNGSAFQKPYSEKTGELIDEEVSRIIEEQYDRAIKILSENKDKLTALAEELLKSEVIFKDNLVKIFGERIWDMNKDKTPVGKLEEAFKEAEEGPAVDLDTKPEFTKPTEFSSPEISESEENSLSSEEEPIDHKSSAEPLKTEEDGE